MVALQNLLRAVKTILFTVSSLLRVLHPLQSYSGADFFPQKGMKASAEIFVLATLFYHSAMLDHETLTYFNFSYATDIPLVM